MIDPEPWVARPHRGPRAKPFPLTPEQREAVEAAVRPAKTEVRLAKRAEGLLLMAAGVGSHDIAMLIGVHVRTVFRWKARFANADDPAQKLADAPRSGRPASLSRKPMQRVSRRRRAGLRKMSASR
jgi:transposase